jgi:hypothetical protein
MNHLFSSLVTIKKSLLLIDMGAFSTKMDQSARSFISMIASQVYLMAHSLEVVSDDTIETKQSQDQLEYHAIVL